MGVAGASLSNQSILITGLAGLLAGACSMALGEWLSVQSSRELYMNQIKIEREEVESAPEEEEEELSLIFQSRGLSAEQASMIAKQIMSDREKAIETLAKEELNIDPSELGGSAWEAAITSFVLFSIGAIVPVLPYIFAGGTTAFIISVVLSGLALFGVGAAITLFTGKTVHIGNTYGRFWINGCRNYIRYWKTNRGQCSRVTHKKRAVRFFYRTAPFFIRYCFFEKSTPNFQHPY
jgi:VIT1/CCC1 family predicted Fe2+/Mn2+ transporter